MKRVPGSGALTGRGIWRQGRRPSGPIWRLHPGDPEAGKYLKGGEGGGRGGLGPKKFCTKNGPTRFSLFQITFFPTVVTLIWRGGGFPGGGYPPLLLYGHSNVSLP